MLDANLRVTSQRKVLHWLKMKNATLPTDDMFIFYLFFLNFELMKLLADDFRTKTMYPANFCPWVMLGKKKKKKRFVSWTFAKNAKCYAFFFFFFFRKWAMRMGEFFFYCVFGPLFFSNKKKKKIGSARRAMRQKWFTYLCTRVCETNIFFLGLII